MAGEPVILSTSSILLLAETVESLMTMTIFRKALVSVETAGPIRWRSKDRT